jgi:threonine dehydrogenase-like Zn-dependent dehydrogenase
MPTIIIVRNIQKGITIYIFYVKHKKPIMKALVYHGPRDVQIDDKPRPSIQHPQDAILRITSTALCGSDLHLYHGTVQGMEPGQTLGHEFMGIVEEAGPEVHEVKVGDKVVFHLTLTAVTAGSVGMNCGPNVTGLIQKAN